MLQSSHHGIGPAVSTLTIDSIEKCLIDSDEEMKLRTEPGGSDFPTTHDATLPCLQDDTTNATLSLEHERESQQNLLQSSSPIEITRPQFDADNSATYNEHVSLSSHLNEDVSLISQSNKPQVDDCASRAEHDCITRIVKVINRNDSTQDRAPGEETQEYNKEKELQLPLFDQKDSNRVFQLLFEASHDVKCNEIDTLGEHERENVLRMKADRNTDMIDAESSASLSTAFYSCLGESFGNGISERESSTVSFHTAMISGSDSMMGKGSTLKSAERDFLTCREHGESSSHTFDITSRLEEQSTSELSNSFCSYYTCGNIPLDLAVNICVESTLKGALKESRQVGQKMNWLKILQGPLSLLFYLLLLEYCSKLGKGIIMQMFL
jgi:hypothetical protein